MPVFRQRKEGHHAEVTTIELFFDLVFVIAVTQVSHALLEHLTWIGALQAAILLVIVWMAWISTTWFTNWVDPHHPAVRVMLLMLMAIGIVMSASVPEAFGDRGVPFAAAYVAFQLSRTGFVLVAARDPKLRRIFVHVFVWMAAAGGVWLAGAFFDGQARLLVWLVALAIDLAGPGVSYWLPWLGPSKTRDWTIEGSHIAERAGLFLLIALGESILVTGLAFAGSRWSLEVVAAMGIALVGSMAMWWIYFGQVASDATQAIAKAADPGRLARVAYTYVPLLLVAGIVVGAVGDELVLSHPTGRVGIATALVVIGGPAIYLLGATLFELSVFSTWSISRLGGIVALLAVAPFAPVVSPLVLSGLVAGVLTVVAAVEGVTVRWRRGRYAQYQIGERGR